MATEQLVEAVRALVSGDPAEQLASHLRRYHALRDALRAHDEERHPAVATVPVECCGCAERFELMSDEHINHQCSGVRLATAAEVIAAIHTPGAVGEYHPNDCDHITPGATLVFAGRRLCPRCKAVLGWAEETSEGGTNMGAAGEKPESGTPDRSTNGHHEGGVELGTPASGSTPAEREPPTWTASLDATWDNAIEACVALVNPDSSLVAQFRALRRKPDSSREAWKRAEAEGYHKGVKESADHILQLERTRASALEERARIRAGLIAAAGRRGEMLDIEALDIIADRRPSSPDEDETALAPWRVGRKVGTTLYCYDRFIGSCIDEAHARELVADANRGAAIEFPKTSAPSVSSQGAETGGREEAGGTSSNASADSSASAPLADRDPESAPFGDGPLSWADCDVEPFSSRACDRGTKGCRISHAKLEAVTRDAEAQGFRCVHSVDVPEGQWAVEVCGGGDADFRTMFASGVQSFTIAEYPSHGGDEARDACEWYAKQFRTAMRNLGAPPERTPRRSDVQRVRAAHGPRTTVADYIESALARLSEADETVECCLAPIGEKDGTSAEDAENFKDADGEVRLALWNATEDLKAALRLAQRGAAAKKEGT